MLPIALGTGFTSVGLLMGLLEVHYRRMPAWNRPRWVLGRVYARLWSPVRRCLVLAGPLVVAWDSVPLAAGIGLALLATATWLAWVRSERHSKRSFRRAFERLRAERPGESDRAILREMVRARHARWADDLLDRIVDDHPSPDDLARILHRMERAWDL